MSPKVEKYSRREFLKVAGTAAVGGLLAACAPKATPVPEEPEPEAPPEEEPVEEEPVEEEPVEEEPVEEEPTEAPAEAEKIPVLYWAAWSPTHEDVLNRMADVCEEEHPELEITVVAGGPGGGDFHEILLARISAGNPPDVATIWTGPVSFGLTGALTPLDDYMAVADYAKPDAFFEGSLQCCQFRGKTYSLPHSNQAAAILYNGTVFEEMGVSPEPEDFPTTWDDLRALSAKFVEWEGDTLNTAGFIPFMPNEYTVQWLLEIWFQLNGGIGYDVEAVKYDIDSEQNAEVLEYWLSWLDEQYQGDVDKISASGTWSDLNEESGLVLGQAAMVQAGQWTLSYEFLQEFVTNNRLEMAKLPVGPGGSRHVTGSWPNYMAVPTGAAQPDGGFLMAEAFSTYANRPWYEEVFDLPSWKDFPYDVLSAGVLANFGEERALEVTKWWFDVRADSYPQWNSPVQEYADDTLGATLDQIMHKTVSVSEGLAEAQAAIQAQLEQVLAGAE